MPSMWFADVMLPIFVLRFLQMPTTSHYSYLIHACGKLQQTCACGT
jgi:hypothetical protein